MRDRDELFAALEKSRFRSQFRLRAKELRYVNEKGLPTLVEHARDFVHSRLASANPENDGRQTPTRGHPVFVAQHATGTCCRSCLAKWHGIAKGASLSADEVDYVVAVIAAWIEQQAAGEDFQNESTGKPGTARHADVKQRRLF